MCVCGPIGQTTISEIHLLAICQDEQDDINSIENRKCLACVCSCVCGGVPVCVCRCNQNGSGHEPHYASPANNPSNTCGASPWQRVPQGKHCESPLSLQLANDPDDVQLGTSTAFSSLNPRIPSLLTQPEPNFYCFLPFFLSSLSFLRSFLLSLCLFFLSFVCLSIYLASARALAARRRGRRGR